MSEKNKKRRILIEIEDSGGIDIKPEQIKNLFKMLGKIEKAGSLAGIGPDLFLSQNLLITVNKNLKHFKKMEVES